MITTRLIQGMVTSCIAMLLSQLLYASTLQDVRQKGFIHCGVHSSLPGFAIQSDQGWQGLEVDLCRAIAAAVLNDAQKVRLTPIASEQGYNLLQSGEIDLLVRHNEWTMLPDTALGLTFVTPWYYQEQAFIARLEAGINQLSDLNKKKICLYPDAEKSIKGLADNVERIGFPSFGIAVKAFENSQCDALPGEVSRLAIARLNFPNTIKTQIIVTDISPTPVAPLIRQGDHEWFKIVRWITYWLLNAEKTGITQTSITQLKSTQPASQLIKAAGLSGSTIGLDANWPIQVIQQIGNYGEIFDRHFGDYQLPRGANNLHHKGGLHFAPPIE